jgi:aspartyl-tRNA(Asn)/glutamyl-tRNA(Gln) amidotransferase subunit B
MSQYFLTVGLEIHAELSTQTKMFCRSRNHTNTSEPEDRVYPNANVCPVCLGYPGTLPVLNKEAVLRVLRLGVAAGGEIADYTEFDRKNYFYPDIPKGYQISQYKNPLVKGGVVAGIRLTRIHLEEDTARSQHSANVFGKEELSITDNSLLDFNRAGVPLMELVTEPVIRSAEEAVAFARELQLLLKYLNVSEANMEKGEMRVEANISVSKSMGESASLTVQKPSGTKVEVKNLNSFKVVEKAIKYEMNRHIGLLESGQVVVQETRGWDENKEETFAQRLKESAHGYRYFPEPDLPKLFIKQMAEFDETVIRESLPELPWQKRERYAKDFGLKEGDIEIYVREPAWGQFFEDTQVILHERALAQLTSNYITSDLKKIISAQSLSEVIRMVSVGTISSRGAKDILKILEDEGGDSNIIAHERKLIQNSDYDALEVVARKIMKDNPQAVVEYQKGKITSLKFLVGQAMKELSGSANPLLLNEIFLKIL